jgi:Fe-S cluster assembly iron-binding protein IscA
MRLLGQGRRRAVVAGHRLRARRRAGDPEIREGIKAYGDWPTIPQLYVGGDLVGGSDIIEQMVNSGELHTLLGLPAPDRTPPAITITPAAAAMLRDALANAGDGYALQIDVDARFNAKLQLAPVDANAIAVEHDGIRAQFDMASARRAQGLRIDWVDDERGRGLVIDNPNAPPRVQPLSVVEADARAAAGSLTLVDVRPAEERALASVNVPFRCSTAMACRTWRRCPRTRRWPSCATTAAAARRRRNTSAAWVSATCTTSKAASKRGRRKPIRTCRVTEDSDAARMRRG